MPNPPMISFMGLDGSGKSTAIAYVYEQLKSRGYKVKIVRAAYVVVVLRGIIQLGKKLLLKKNSNPFAGNYRAYLENLRKQSNKKGIYPLFSFLTTLEFKIQIFWNIRLKRLFGTILLVDRYIYDNAVTYAANRGLDEAYMRQIIEKKWKNSPKPNQLIYIKTPVEICLSRKNDIPDPLYLQIRQPLYDKIAALYNAVVISGQQDKQTMCEQVLRTVEQILPAQSEVQA